MGGAGLRSKCGTSTGKPDQQIHLPAGKTSRKRLIEKLSQLPVAGPPRAVNNYAAGAKEDGPCNSTSRATSSHAVLARDASPMKYHNTPLTQFATYDNGRVGVLGFGEWVRETSTSATALTGRGLFDLGRK